MNPLFSLAIVILLIILLIRFLYWMQQQNFFQKKITLFQKTADMSLLSVIKIDERHKVVAIQIAHQKKIILLGPQSEKILHEELIIPEKKAM